MRSLGDLSKYKRAFVVVAAIIFLGVAGTIYSGCYYVDAGYVGIVVNLYGTNRGVDDITIRTGRVFINPITQAYHQFPIYQQTANWDKSDLGDNRITFNSKEGAELRAGVAFSYTIVAEKTPFIFNKYRKDLPIIQEQYLYNEVKNALSSEASKHDAAAIFGSGRSAIVSDTYANLKAHLEPFGFQVEMLTFTSAIEAPDNIRSSINKVIEAAQATLAAEQKIKQIEAESKQKVAEASGLAESVLIKAKADAEANELITKSLTPDLIRFKTLDKWDGALPKLMGSNVLPFVDVSKSAE